MAEESNYYQRGKVDWKVLAVIVVGGILVVTAIFGSGFEVFNNSTGFFTFLEPSGDGNVSFTADFDLMDFSINTPAETITLRFSTEHPFEINGETWDFTGGETVIEGFKGTVEVEENRLITLDGEAEKISTPTGVVSKKDSKLRLLTSKLPADSAFFSGIELRNFELEEVSGTLTVGGTSSNTLDDTNVAFRLLHGNYDIESRNLVITGTSDQINIDGEVDVRFTD